MQKNIVAIALFLSTSLTFCSQTHTTKSQKPAPSQVATLAATSSSKPEARSAKRLEPAHRESRHSRPSKRQQLVEAGKTHAAEIGYFSSLLTHRDAYIRQLQIYTEQQRVVIMAREAEIADLRNNSKAQDVTIFLMQLQLQQLQQSQQSGDIPESSSRQ